MKDVKPVGRGITSKKTVKKFLLFVKQYLKCIWMIDI